MREHLKRLTRSGGRRASEAERRPGVLCAPMQVTVDVPEDILRALEVQWPHLSRQALEAIAVEGYRTGAFTENQVRRLLGLESRFEVHALLKEHRVPLRYTADDVEDDKRAHRELGIVPGR